MVLALPDRKCLQVMLCFHILVPWERKQQMMKALLTELMHVERALTRLIQTKDLGG